MFSLRTWTKTGMERGRYFLNFHFLKVRVPEMIAVNILVPGEWGVRTRAVLSELSFSESTSSRDDSCEYFSAWRVGCENEGRTF